MDEEKLQGMTAGEDSELTKFLNSGNPQKALQLVSCVSSLLNAGSEETGNEGGDKKTEQTKARTEVFNDFTTSLISNALSDFSGSCSLDPGLNGIRPFCHRRDVIEGCTLHRRHAGHSDCSQGRDFS